MMKTVLITGASSGFGEATAQFYANQGWNVIATMRNPRSKHRLTDGPNMFITRMDVEDHQSIESAINAGIGRFGRIDVLVNNAGYGLFGAFEGATRSAIQAQFNVNVFGAMDVIRAILPHFRANRAGTIVNVSSGAGALGFPMASIYCASKFALEGFSEALSYELGALGIKVKVIEPGGAGKTNFMTRVGLEGAGLQRIDDYLPWLEQIGKLYAAFQDASDPDAVETVAASIFEASTDGRDQLRYAPTNDIQPMLKARRSTSEAEYRAEMLSIFASGQV